MSSNPISAITDPISKAIGTDGSGGGVLGALADIDPGPALGNIGESIDKAVTQPVSRALAEADKSTGYLLGKAAPAVAAYFLAPYAAPYLTGQGTVASGFAGLDAATAAELGLSGGSGLGTAGASGDVLAGLAGLSEAAPAMAATAAEVGTALPYTEAFDAVNQATRLGLSEADIARNLTTTGMKDYLAQDMARLATQGLSPDQIVQTLSYSYSPAELAGTGIQSKALGLASKGITATQALMGARLASGLLGRAQQQPQLRQPQLQMPQIRPAGAVDYSGLLNLLSPRATTRNTNSLLG